MKDNNLEEEIMIGMGEEDGEIGKPHNKIMGFSHIYSD